VHQPVPGRRARRGAPGGHGKPAGPEGGGPADVFVYREPDPDADAREERDAAYWYDLAAEEREPAAPAAGPTRGPFEPLVSSSGPPPERPPPPSPEADPVPGAEAVGATEQPDARAQRLEQIKDLYMTAEAIGEENVGKHFDELLAQQRALISDYFKQSKTAEVGADPGPSGPAAGSGPSRDAGVAAERPGTR
jgi:hypothetical protein